ncbi:MAG: RNA-processing protein [Candidatus Diapherotrites archaeon]|nr:RNA-processing protein [Candidatus Diapherotrites archaeon]
MFFGEEVRVPRGRIGALIGPQGSIKKALEQKSGIRLEVDSEDGLVTFKTTPQTNQLKLLKLGQAVKAIARGFAPEKAFRLLDEEDTILELIDLAEFAGKSEKSMLVKKGRVIGRDGSARTEIEQSTGAQVSVFGKTIALIGDPEQIDRARRAVEMLLSGAQHVSVFHFVHRNETGKFEL